MPDITLNMGSFEMERMLRLNAHEKAFEIQVQAQRSYENELNKLVYEAEKDAKKVVEEKKQEKE